MKKFLTVLIVIMIFATNAVFAGGFGENEHKKHGKQEQEQKQEQNQNQKQQQSVEVITGDVSATGGNATGDISSSQ